MKKNIKAICITEIALLFFTIIFYMLTKVVSSDLKSYLAAAFLVILLIPNIIIFGFSNDRNHHSGYILRVVVTVLMATAIVIYLLGLILGFTRGYRFSAHNFCYYIIPIILITVLSEMLRYIVVKHSYENRILIILFTTFLSIFQILLETNYGVLDTHYNRFIYISTVVFPIFAENFICTYLVRKGNANISMVFKLIVGLYMYIFPIVPNLGYYLYAVMKIMVPYIIFFIINKNILSDDNKKVFISKSNQIYAFPVLILTIVLVILIAGLFRYKLIAVATNSMNDTFYRGDAVLVEYHDASDIQLGDILVFEYDHRIITHRVVKKERKNSKLYFTTKGDANTSIDNYLIPEEKVIGKVNLVIKYIGYPTVWTKELIERGN